MVRPTTEHSLWHCGVRVALWFVALWHSLWHCGLHIPDHAREGWNRSHAADSLLLVLECGQPHMALARNLERCGYVASRRLYKAYSVVIAPILHSVIGAITTVCCTV